MQKHILILVLIATVIVAGCLGPSETPPAQNIEVPAGDAAAIDTGAGNIESGITDAEATQSELNPDISDADLDLGV